jgi:hypothetical protein
MPRGSSPLPIRDPSAPLFARRVEPRVSFFVPVASPRTKGSADWRDRLVKLTRKEWSLLYKMILVVALRLTYTKVKELDWTARDRAQEAVQRAFERFLRNDPPGVRDFETAKGYLAAAVRSELSNVKKREAHRRTKEDAAALEDSTISGGSAASPERMNLDRGERVVDQSRAVRMVAKCREILADDTLALGTMDLMADGTMDVREHARILKCEVEDIFNARKRRKRAMEKAEEAVRAEDAADPAKDDKEKK